MDPEPDLSKQDPEEIRRQMELTRSSLTEKLETLEQEVKETVVGAKEAVTETVSTVKESVEGTVETVKGAVQDTMQTVKHTFDLKRQVENHPWGMLCGSMFAGFLLGNLAGPISLPRRREYFRGPAQPNGPATAEAQPPQPSFLSELTHKFDREIDQLKGVAIGMAVSVLRDTITENLPENLSPRVREVMDNITTKLGGEPIPGKVLEPSTEDGAFAANAPRQEGFRPPESARPAETRRF